MLPQQRPVSVAKQRDVGDAERADRLAVVAATQPRIVRLSACAALLPVVEAHLERDLGGGRAVGCVERMRETGRQGGQPLRELDRGGMREAGEHRVRQRVELLGDGSVDARVRMPEQVDPPRAHRIEIAAAVEVMQPRATPARDRHERRLLVVLHLRARMPHRGAAARHPARVLRGHRSRFRVSCGSAARQRSRCCIRCTAATSSRVVPGSRTE